MPAGPSHWCEGPSSRIGAGPTATPPLPGGRAAAPSRAPARPPPPEQSPPADARGDVTTTNFDPATPLITTVSAPVSVSNPRGTDNPGLGTGSVTAPQQQSLQQQLANEP